VILPNLAVLDQGGAAARRRTQPHLAAGVRPWRADPPRRGWATCADDDLVQVRWLSPRDDGQLDLPSGGHAELSRGGQFDHLV
jgi:hypothetical protein